ncbi:hypothetical protein ACIQXD_04900 [Streptomyces uncialis]|uniref:hypothetical protein n=1 Tax=Streptomyces uncialis TaxID=1048205 RepID=UPI0038140F73
MITLFGCQRTLVGPAEQEWAVWVHGPDDVHARTSLPEALELAATLNASFAHLRLSTPPSEYDPVLHAVVLHWGHAWTPETDHAHGIPCGRDTCTTGPCQPASVAAGGAA